MEAHRENPNSSAILRGFRVVIINAVAFVVLVELVLQALSIWVQPEKLVRNFSNQDAAVQCLVLGDSNTYGLYLKREEAWPAQFEKAWNQTESPKLSVLNLAYPGTNTVRLASEINTILDATSPDMVLIMAGSNDFWTTDLPESDVWNKNSLVSALKTPKLLDLLKKEFSYKNQVGYEREDFFKSIEKIPEEVGHKNLIKQLEFDGVLVSCKENLCYAENKSKNKKISIKDFYSLLKNTENKIEQRAEHRYTDPGEIAQLYYAETLIYNLQYEFYDLTKPGGIVSYGGHQFTLGPHFDRSDTKKINIQQRLIDNYGEIKQAALERGIPIFMMNYHLNNPIQRDLKMASDQHGIPLIDINAEMNRVCNPGKCPEYIFSDGHPNRKGQQIIANAVFDFFKNESFCQSLLDKPSCR